jgi:uncharacterized protein YfaP (DUF2135 family)
MKSITMYKELSMDKRFKILGIVFVVSLMVLPLSGCTAPWDSGTSLTLKVDAPRNGTTVTTPTVTVTGRVLGTQKAAAKVAINGAEVPVKDGKFSTNVTLAEGANVITIVATSGPANPSKKVTVTYAPAT